MESLGRYLTTVAAAAIICSVLEKFSGKGSAASATIKMMCGIFMVLTVVNPWLKLRVYDFSAYAESFSEQACAARDSGMEAAEEYKRSIISEKVTTYILDKAAGMDLEIAVDVMLTADEECIPCGVTISGAVPEEKRLQLERILQEELGIGRSDQIWIG